jgi:hypothetical protein
MHLTRYLGCGSLVSLAARPSNVRTVARTAQGRSPRRAKGERLSRVARAGAEVFEKPRVCSSLCRLPRFARRARGPCTASRLASCLALTTSAQSARRRATTVSPRREKRARAFLRNDILSLDERGISGWERDAYGASAYTGRERYKRETRSERVLPWGGPLGLPDLTRQFRLFDICALYSRLTAADCAEQVDLRRKR